MGIEGDRSEDDAWPASGIQGRGQVQGDAVRLSGDTRSGVDACGFDCTCERQESYEELPIEMVNEIELEADERK